MGYEAYFSEAGLQVIIDGAGSPLIVGEKGYIDAPFACIIDKVKLLAKPSGSVKVDIWKCTYAQFDGGATHPVDGDSICGGNEPEIAASTKYQDSTLTGWTRELNEGDALAFNVDSCTDITGVTVIIKVRKL